MLKRVCTWLKDFTAIATAGTKSVKPMTSHDTRFVATYSIATNRPKKSSEVPRSRCRTRIAMPISHTTMIGPRSRARGRRMPRNLRPPIARLSRFVTRYPAKKIASVIFTSSPGWTEMGPRWIQTRAPKVSWPRPGIIGRSRRNSDSAPKV